MGADGRVRGQWRRAVEVLIRKRAATARSIEVSASCCGSERAVEVIVAGALSTSAGRSGSTPRARCVSARHCPAARAWRVALGASDADEPRTLIRGGMTYGTPPMDSLGFGLPPDAFAEAG
jgi:hypothetical protein